MYWRPSQLLAGVLSTSTLTSLTVTASNDDFPIGIGLGMDEITSAYITDDGSFITVASIQATKVWNEFSSSFYGMSLDQKSKRLQASEFKQLFITELSSIKKATEAKSGREIDIIGISCPGHLSYTEYQQMLINTASEMQPHLKHGAYSWMDLRIAEFAHNLNDAETLGYPSGINIDREINNIIHFDYQTSLLKVTITGIGTMTTEVLTSCQIPDFGGTGQNASPEKLELLRNRLIARVKSVLEGWPGRYGPSELSDFKAIIFSGNAPDSEFQKIRESILQVYPQFTELFVAGIEPRWVTAVGAARLARLYKLHPFTYDDCSPELGPHDEL